MELIRGIFWSVKGRPMRHKIAINGCSKFHFIIADSHTLGHMNAKPWWGYDYEFEWVLKICCFSCVIINFWPPDRILFIINFTFFYLSLSIIYTSIEQSMIANWLFTSWMYQHRLFKCFDTYKYRKSITPESYPRMSWYQLDSNI